MLQSRRRRRAARRKVEENACEKPREEFEATRDEEVKEETNVILRTSRVDRLAEPLAGSVEDWVEEGEDDMISPRERGREEEMKTHPESSGRKRRGNNCSG